MDDFVDCRNGMFVVDNRGGLQASDRYSPDDVPNTFQSLVEHLSIQCQIKYYRMISYERGYFIADLHSSPYKGTTDTKKDIYPIQAFARYIRRKNHRNRVQDLKGHSRKKRIIWPMQIRSLYRRQTGRGSQLLRFEKNCPK